MVDCWSLFLSFCTVLEIDTVVHTVVGRACVLLYSQKLAYACHAYNTHTFPRLRSIWTIYQLMHLTLQMLSAMSHLFSLMPDGEVCI